MNVLLECLPCNLRQALEAARMANCDTAVQEEVMEEVLSLLCRYREYPNSPAIGRAVQEIVKGKTGCADPYRAMKDQAIASALKVYPTLERSLERADDSLYRALKIAATGNIIDAAVSDEVTVDEGIEAELERPFSICDIDCFRDRLASARTLLIIGDNAGETVFDRLLVGHLRGYDITYAVRSGPVINDATVADALASGLTDGVRVISTGCDAPGTILSECSEEFLRIYRDADIVISKGQGNYETLSDADREIFFLLKAKCPVIASFFGVNVNDYIFQRHMPGGRRGAQS